MTAKELAEIVVDDWDAVSLTEFAARELAAWWESEEGREDFEARLADYEGVPA